jgi:CO/xanthine dehydrogenase Mo-binding subunit
VTAPTSLPGFLIGEQLPDRRGAKQPRTIETEVVDEGQGPGDASPTAGDGVGRAVPAAKAAGRYPFAGDLTAPGMLWAVMARSPYASATVLSVDTTAARAMPGVHAVLAGPELGVSVVDYLGQCVAVAAAEHPALARAALDAVVIEYAPGKPLTDPRQAFHAAPIHPDGNVAAHLHFVQGVAPAADEELVSSAHGYEFSRPADWPAAPGAVFAVPDGDLRVAAALLAVRTGRPVKAVDRGAGNWPAGTAEPAVRVHATHVADAEGVLREIRVELVVDGGAEPAAAEALLDEYCRLATGPYRVPRVDVQGWVVRTNNPPLGPWPGGGAALAALVAEAQLDALAAAAGRTGLELRVKNLIRSGDLLPDGRRVAAPAPVPELITAVLEASVPRFPPGPDVREFPGTVGRTGEITRLRRGVGIAVAMVDLVPPGLPEERATAQVALTSDVHGPIAHVSTAMVDTGAGQHALLRRIVREALGVSRVLVRRPADPADLPATAIGPGRAAWLHGMAVQRAARAVRAQVFAGVAAKFAISPELLEVRGDQVVSYDGVLSRPLDQVYAASLRGAAVYIADGEFRVRSSGPAEPGVFVPEEGQAHLAFAVHRAVVDADTELGLIRPVRVTAAHDAGRALVPGRIEAAIAAGIVSAATYVFADEAAPARAAAGALAATQLPTMLDLPEVDILPLFESSIGDLDTTLLRRRGFSAPLPLGYQPVGRIAHAAAAAALACATRDALGSHRTALPIRPWEPAKEQPGGEAGNGGSARP